MSSNSPTTRIAFLGDVFFGEAAYEARLGEDLAACLGESDLVVANLESPITDLVQPGQPKTCLRNLPPAAQTLREWGVGIVSLANNHMFDFGWAGVKQTRENLDRVAIKSLGAGVDIESASQPLIVESPCGPIGLLAYSWDYIQTVCATENQPGCALLEAALMRRQVERMRNRARHVIVLAHWGYCNYEYPLPSQRQLGSDLLEAGATAVIAHHPHVVQGVLGRDGRMVAFSLGNFFFAGYRDGRRLIQSRGAERLGLVVRLELDANGIVADRLIPIRQAGLMTQLDTRPKRLRRIERLSGQLDRPDYPMFWGKVKRRHLIRRGLHWLNPWNWRTVRKGTIAAGAKLLLSVMGGKRSKSLQGQPSGSRSK